MNTRQITLCGVPYRVTEQDRQVIFENQSGFYDTFTRFAFEWKGSGWYFVDFEDRFDRIYAPHLAAAMEWIDANFAVIWTDGVGAISLIAEPSKQTD